MKRIYQAPKMEVIQFEEQANLLVDSVQTLRVYDDEETDQQI